jgi:tetratricopeptide (TPR) repeat protein
MTTGQTIKHVVPLLYDPIKAVRIEAARELLRLPSDQLDTLQRARFEAVLEEYKQAMAHTADFAPSRHNLGNLYADLQQLDRAEENYLAAIRIDALFYPAKVNLAMLYNREGKNEAAERLLREVVGEHPDMYDIQYSLGLLQAERKNYSDAAMNLSMAARGLPDRGRVHYNLGLLLEYLGKDLEAEAALQNAVEIEPENMDFLTALAEFYLKRQHYGQAKSLAQRMVAVNPANPVGAQILNFVEARKNTN